MENTCYICEVCKGCLKHNLCPTISKIGKCEGNFDRTCEGKPRKYKTGVE